MVDERRFYIAQLLRNYKQGDLFDFSKNKYNSYCVNYTLYGDKGEQYKIFGHNEGIEFVIDYIRELETKLDKLQDIERIIKVARRGDYGNYSV